MQWHPTMSTLLMVACEDDMSPVIQLWDLRSAAAMTPARELLGHNKVPLQTPCNLYGSLVALFVCHPGFCGGVELVNESFSHLQA